MYFAPNHDNQLRGLILLASQGTEDLPNRDNTLNKNT